MPYLGYGYGMGYGYGFGIDPAYLVLVVVSLVLGLATQGYINSTYKTWSKVRSDGASGADVARRMANGQMAIFLGRAKQYACEKRAKRGRRASSEWRHCRDAADDSQKRAVLGSSPVFDGRDGRRAKLMDAQGTGKMTTGDKRRNRYDISCV